MNRIVWATPAQEDLADIVDYLSLESTSAAATFIDRVDASVKQLAEHVHIGRVVPELERHNITKYRELILTPWRLFYRAEQRTVSVLAVIDGRRNVEDILLRRMMRE